MLRGSQRGSHWIRWQTPHLETWDHCYASSMRRGLWSHQQRGLECLPWKEICLCSLLEQEAPVANSAEPEEGGVTCLERGMQRNGMMAVSGHSSHPPLLKQVLGVSVLQDSANICAHQTVLLWPHPPRLQCCDRRVCAHVPGWHCWLCHHRLWLLGLRGRLGTKATTRSMSKRDAVLWNATHGWTCCFLTRNTQQQQTSPLHCRRTRFLGRFWWWSSFSLEPWWWTEPYTWGRLYWERSFFRSFSCLEFISGCSSSCPVWLRGKVEAGDVHSLWWVIIP